jgi:hypothetical protein
LKMTWRNHVANQASVVFIRSTTTQLSSPSRDSSRSVLLREASKPDVYCPVSDACDTAQQIYSARAYSKIPQCSFAGQLSCQAPACATTASRALQKRLFARVPRPPLQSRARCLNPLTTLALFILPSLPSSHSFTHLHHPKTTRSQQLTAAAHRSLHASLQPRHTSHSGLTCAHRSMKKFKLPDSGLIQHIPRGDARG